MCSSMILAGNVADVMSGIHYATIHFHTQRNYYKMATAITKNSIYGKVHDLLLVLHQPPTPPLVLSTLMVIA
jgi:hypothetical protein